jgi:hypothetical protein
MRGCYVVLCRDATDDDYVRVTVLAEDSLIAGQGQPRQAPQCRELPVPSR